MAGIGRATSFSTGGVWLPWPVDASVFFSVEQFAKPSFAVLMTPGRTGGDFIGGLERKGLHCRGRLVETAPRWCGRLAQLVEQLTLNQRAVGSNPTAPTNDFSKIKDLGISFVIGAKKWASPHFSLAPARIGQILCGRAAATRPLRSEPCRA